MKTIPPATPITLSTKECKELDALAHARKGEARMRQRARIVLLAADGHGSRSIARAVHCTPDTASRWRVRFAHHRMAGLKETGRRGAQVRPGARPAAAGGLCRLDGPADGTGPRRHPRAIHLALHIWRFLRAQKIDLSGRKSWLGATIPPLCKAAAIAGLYLSPPDNAVVISVDEEPSIQALERAQGYLERDDVRLNRGGFLARQEFGSTCWLEWEASLDGETLL
ncbi:MAG: transposase [Rhodopila sp.]